VTSPDGSAVATTSVPVESRTATSTRTPLGRLATFMTVCKNLRLIPSVIVASVEPAFDKSRVALTVSSLATDDVETRIASPSSVREIDPLVAFVSDQWVGSCHSTGTSSVDVSLSSS